MRGDYGQSLDPERDLYWKKDGHWSVKGNHLAGLLVADYMIEKNLIEVPEKDQRLKEIKAQLKNIN